MPDRHTDRQSDSLGSLTEPKTSYLVTLSKKVGGGQDQITISGSLEIMTSSEGGRGVKKHCLFFFDHFSWYFCKALVLVQGGERDFYDTV